MIILVWIYSKRGNLESFQYDNCKILSLLFKNIDIYIHVYIYRKYLCFKLVNFVHYYDNI